MLQNTLVKKERTRYAAPGILVPVQGATMHIYAQGRGPSLVLLSGWGTVVPSADFQPLMDELKSYCRVIIAEKPGYGFSSGTNRPRTLTVIVEELRAALSASGEKGPYLLCGHSMAGCEAVYWAGCHPEEVRGIVMLDAPAPLCYQTLPLPTDAVWSLFALMRFIGLRRFFLHFPPFVRRMNSHLNGLKLLDPKFLPLMKAMQSGRYLTGPMREEMRRLKENSAQAGGNLPAGMKLLMFIASDTKTRWAMLQPEEDAFIARNRALVIEIAGKHNLQHYAPKEIANHIRQCFIREDAS